MAILASETPTDTTGTVVATTPDTTNSNPAMLADSAGIVTSIKLKLEATGQTGDFPTVTLTATLWGKLTAESDKTVICSGTFDCSAIPDKPEPATLYEVIMDTPASIPFGLGKFLHVETKLNDPPTPNPPFMAQQVWWRGGSGGGNTILEVHGTLTLPSKATDPTPTDDQEDLEITGKDNLKQLAWVTPDGETPDFLVYFRAQGESWVLYETIIDDSTSFTLTSALLDAFEYYSIYEWRVDTRNDNGTTTGDTWTFITQTSPQYTNYTRRSDYDADKVWQPGTGWVDPNTFEYTGGGRYKGRVLVVGHQVIYFGDL